MSDVAVSVVVAVYNREKMLDFCVESLVYQTLDNIEIILVDDYSTDHSWGVMVKWQERFPDKIRIMKSAQKGVANAKNTGIRAAVGQYVTFVDSDDWIDYKALGLLYQYAVENDSEVVVSSIWKVNRGNTKKICILPKEKEPYSIADFLDTADMWYLPGKLIRRDLFERFGLLPVLRRGEDLAWLFPVFSRLAHIEYLRRTFYYYEIQDDSICSQLLDESIVNDILKGSDLLVDSVAPVYSDRALAFSLRRMHNLKRVYPVYSDLFSEWISKRSEQAEKMLECNSSSCLQAAIQYCGEDCRKMGSLIPQRVYLNGFKPIDESEKYTAVFRDPPELVLLNTDTCDLSQSPTLVQQAYEAGNMEFVGKYFAVKACFEQGGVFVDADVVIDAPFNMLLGDPCFFGFESNERFTDKLFGSCPGNGCVQQILKTYEYSDLYSDPFAPLHERIKTVLVGSGNVLLKSKVSRQLDRGFCLYPVEMFVCVLPGASDLHVCHYRAFGGRNDQELSIPVDILTALYERRIEIEKGKLNVQKIKRDRDWLQEKRKQLEKDRDWLQEKRKQLESELNDYKRSPLVLAAWKCHQLLRKVKRKILSH